MSWREKIAKALAQRGAPTTTEMNKILPGDTRVSTRFPTGVKATEDPLRQHLSIGAAEMKATGPELYTHNVGILSSYPGFAHLKDLNPDEAVQAYLNQTRGNLQYLYDRSPAVMKERSPHWYDGAHEVSDAFASRWGIPRPSSSAAIAALSPQMDWFKNASLAERVGDIVTGANAGKRMTPEMMSWADNAGFIKPKMMKNGKMDTENLDIYAAIRGKSLDQIDDPVERAMWVRIFDEAHNPRHYRSVTPEGNLGEFITNKDGSLSKIGWGQLGEISKAVRAIESGGDMDTISPLLGNKHKVRSFYNNIELPNDPRFGDITADTHAVAASQLRPLSGNSPAVLHNLLSGGPAGAVNAKASSVSGVQGTYGLTADATRMMAMEHDMLPRQAQSATWEPVRELFTDTFKRSPKAGAVDDVWKAYDRGEIGLDDARDTIFNLGGGIGTPEWARPGLETFAPTRGSTYR